MNNDEEKWQWVDEDPIEKLLRGRKGYQAANSPPEPAKCVEPLLPEEVAGESSTNLSLDQAPSEVQPVSQAELPAPDRRGSFERAARKYFGAVAATSGDSAEHRAHPVTVESPEQWEAAANSFRQALKSDGGNAQALIGLGDCLLHLDRAEEALAGFEQCLSSNTERERALFGKAVALQKLERYQDAERAYRELLQITPNVAEPLANLIAMSVARRDWAALDEYSRRLVRLDPRSKTALQGLATHAIWIGDRDAAIDYCTRLLEVEPASFEGWFNLGFTKHRMRPSKRSMRSIA